MAGKKALQAVGRRKTSVARIYMMPGKGAITINHREIDDYYIRATSKMVVRQPLELTGEVDKWDIAINVFGGGLSGQAEAIRHGISRILASLDPEKKKILKGESLLTRDARKKERKLPGLRSSRARFQFSKR
jgi:small subunit ribosomal protein S9